MALVLIFGIPASGKTLLARSVLKQLTQDKEKEVSWLAVHYDDFYPPDTRCKEVKLSCNRSCSPLSFSLSVLTREMLLESCLT